MKGDMGCPRCYGTGLINKIEKHESITSDGKYTTRVHTTVKCTFDRRKLRKIRLRIGDEI
jgi:hypothetical protein